MTLITSLFSKLTIFSLFHAYNSKMLFWPFSTNLAQIFPSLLLTFETDHIAAFKINIFSPFNANNSKMLSRLFFIWFGSNFHLPPIFWHQSHSCFQNWHFFLRFTPIAQKSYFGNFSTNLAQIFPSFLTFDTWWSRKHWNTKNMPSFDTHKMRYFRFIVEIVHKAVILISYFL